MLFRPEEEHVRSGEPDVVPPARGWDAEMDDARGRGETTAVHAHIQAIATMGAPGAHGAGATEHGHDPERVPDAVAEPRSALDVRGERRGDRGERVRHPDVGRP